MGKKTQGRRCLDTLESEGRVPEDLKSGDYWKVIREDGSFFWHVACPWIGAKNDEAYLLANLANHRVREHEDGTISVRPGDGSSNSILVNGHNGSWHGYIDHGVLEEC